MKKYNNCIISSFLVLFCTLCVSAQSNENTRRIEEKKRASLKASEHVSGHQAVSSDEDGSLEAAFEYDYFKGLMNRNVTYITDASRIIALFLGINETIPDEKKQFEKLQELGIIPASMSYDEAEDIILRKGRCAVMVTRALKIKGGIFMHLFPKSERYAFKELVHMGIMPSGYISEIVNGRMLVITLIGAINYLAATY